MTMQSLAALSEDELLVRISEALAPSTGFGGDDWQILVKRGKAWVEAQSDRIREAICGKVDETGDLLTDASAASLALTPLFKDSAIVLALSMLVAKHGLKAYCAPPPH